MAERVIILGAGFGGLEVATMLSEGGDGDVDVTLIDKGDGFVFGFSKLELMFGRATPEQVRMPYSDDRQAGRALCCGRRSPRSTRQARRVTTDAGVHEADVLVIALGADYDFEARRASPRAGNEFYSVAGAERLGGILPSSRRATP